MEKNHDLKVKSVVFTSADEAENDPMEDQEAQKLLSKLEQETYWNGETLFKYKGFWYYLRLLKPVLRIERYFKPRDTDIILSSMPKSGTWLKALTYSITNRNVHAPADQTTHPLYISNPHELVPTLELSLYKRRQNPNLKGVPNPNPLDRLVSERYFFLENGLTNRDATTLFNDESLDEFGRGIVPFGPLWEHAIGYWNAHLENPKKVLFLKYEDLKKDDEYFIKKIDEFLGFPFSPEELESGLVEKISKLCGFDNLSEANKKDQGMLNHIQAKKSSFFRKGEVGDWTNYLSKTWLNA